MDTPLKLLYLAAALSYVLRTFGTARSYTSLALRVGMCCIFPLLPS